MNVLVVEDDFTIGEILSSLLARRNITSRLVTDGRSAIDAWEQGQFRIILMDVQMPILDGMEATRIIREKEKSRGGHVTIIAMTAHAMAEDREQCLQSGMDDYISKPINFNELMALIGKYD